MESESFQLWAKFITSEKGKEGERNKRKKTQRERVGGKEQGDREGRRRRARREGKRDKETQLYMDYAHGRNWYPEISWRPSVCIKKVTEKVG